MFSCLSLSHIAKSRCVTESADEVKTYGILHRKPMYIKKKVVMAAFFTSRHTTQYNRIFVFPLLSHF